MIDVTPTTKLCLLFNRDYYSIRCYFPDVDEHHQATPQKNAYQHYNSRIVFIVIIIVIIMSINKAPARFKFKNLC